MSDHTITRQTTRHTFTATGTTPFDRGVEPFDRAIADLESLLAGQLLVSQDRCVDGLLDVFNAAAGNDLVRQLVGDILDDIRHVSAVRAEQVSARLGEVVAALAVETAFGA